MGIVTGAAPVLTAADRTLALAAVKAQLRVETNADDALIVAFAESALGIAEQFLGQALIVRTIVEQLPAGATWQMLAMVPVRAITGVSASGTTAVDIDAGGVGWVRAPGAAVSVTYEAGLASGWAAVPAAVRQGVVVLAGHLFADRGGTGAVPAAVAALWRPFRTVQLARAVRA